MSQLVRLRNIAGASLDFDMPKMPWPPVYVIYDARLFVGRPGGAVDGVLHYAEVTHPFALTDAMRTGAPAPDGVVVDELVLT